MNLETYLKNAVANLSVAGIPTARLDALILLEDVTGKDRSWLLAHPEFELDYTVIKTLEKQIERRAKHEPLSYIRGKSEFYGRDFFVTPDTLQPRSETETMIDLLKNLQQHKNYVAETRSRPQEKDGVVIVDVGTGSGCLAITAKLEFTAATVYGTDISDSALTVAQKNAKNLNADVTFLKGNLLEPYYILPPEPSTLVLLCNLPYVPNNYEINQAAGYEPSIALFGGQDGLDLYRELFDQISKLQDPSSKIAFILTESLPFQHAELAKIAAQQGYKLETSEDFIQVFKR